VGQIVGPASGAMNPKDFLATQISYTNQPKDNSNWGEIQPDVRAAVTALQRGPSRQGSLQAWEEKIRGGNCNSARNAEGQPPEARARKRHSIAECRLPGDRDPAPRSEPAKAKDFANDRVPEGRRGTRAPVSAVLGNRKACRNASRRIEPWRAPWDKGNLP